MTCDMFVIIFVSDLQHVDVFSPVTPVSSTNKNDMTEVLGAQFVDGRS